MRFRSLEKGEAQVRRCDRLAKWAGASGTIFLLAGLIPYGSQVYTNYAAEPVYEQPEVNMPTMPPWEIAASALGVAGLAISAAAGTRSYLIRRNQEQSETALFETILEDYPELRELEQS